MTKLAGLARKDASGRGHSCIITEAGTTHRPEKQSPECRTWPVVPPKGRTQSGQPGGIMLMAPGVI